MGRHIERQTYITLQHLERHFQGNARILLCTYMYVDLLNKRLVYKCNVIWRLNLLLRIHLIQRKKIVVMRHIISMVRYTKNIMFHIRFRFLQHNPLPHFPCSKICL